MNIPFRRSSLVALVLYSIAAIVNYDYRRTKRIEKKAPDVYQEWFMFILCRSVHWWY